ncbi:MAG: dihydroxyacetone kinase phosphoryl donor subunit DhaM [Clostridiaceae bacterium]
MVGMVLISHSFKIGEGLKELALQMAPEVNISVAAGTKDGRIGTDIDLIIAAIEEVYSEDGVVILFDLGSALMNAEMALEFLEEDKEHKIEIVDTPLVEGAITGAVEISIGKNIREVKELLEEMKLGKKA